MSNNFINKLIYLKKKSSFLFYTSRLNSTLIPLDFVYACSLMTDMYMYVHLNICNTIHHETIL